MDNKYHLRSYDLKIKNVGYEYKNFKLGDTVKFENEKYKIVGFDENEEERFIAIALINKDSIKNRIEIIKSNNVTNCLNEKVMKYRWVSPKQLEV